MLRARIALLLIAVALIISGRAAADVTISLKIVGTEVTDVSIAAPEQLDSDDCPKDSSSADSAFTCLAVDPGNELGVFAISLDGPNLMMYRPIYVRVYPTMKSKITLRLDLSDPVFEKSFANPPGYYASWNDYDHNAAALGDINAYLITKNYFFYLNQNFDNATAVVLHEWTRRATYLAEGHSYLGIDGDDLEEIKDLTSSTAADGLNEYQMNDFNKYGPQLISSDGPTDYQRLPLADWWLYGIVANTKVAPSAPFDQGLCDLFLYFRNNWGTLTSSEQSIVSATWQINQSKLVDDGAKTYLVRCPLPAGG